VIGDGPNGPEDSSTNEQTVPHHSFSIIIIIIIIIIIRFYFFFLVFLLLLLLLWKSRRNCISLLAKVMFVDDHLTQTQLIIKVKNYLTTKTIQNNCNNSPTINAIGGWLSGAKKNKSKKYKQKRRKDNFMFFFCFIILARCCCCSWLCQHVDEVKRYLHFYNYTIQRYLYIA